MKEKMQKINLNPLPMPKQSVPVQVPLNDENLTAENRQLVEKGRVDSVTYYGIEQGMMLAIKMLTKKRTKIRIG